MYKDHRLSIHLRVSLPAAKAQSVSLGPDEILLSSMATGTVLHDAFSLSCDLTSLLCPRPMAPRRADILRWPPVVILLRSTPRANS